MLMKLIEGQRSICICNGESVKNYEQDEAEVVPSSSLVVVEVEVGVEVGYGVILLFPVGG